jgi:hypothetical protein
MKTLVPILFILTYLVVFASNYVPYDEQIPCFGPEGCCGVAFNNAYFNKGGCCWSTKDTTYVSYLKVQPGGLSPDRVK